MEDLKKCCTCQLPLPTVEFNFCSRSKDGLFPRCKTCQRGAARKHKYGLSNKRVAEMIRGQRERCAICRQKFQYEPARGRLAPVIDHNHRTGLVRAILHRQCNVMLGYLGESVELCLFFIDYIRRHSPKASDPFSHSQIMVELHALEAEWKKAKVLPLEIDYRR